MAEMPAGLQAWQVFVRDYGYRARASELAAILGRTKDEVLRERLVRPCRSDAAARRFEDLFSLWNGSAPAEHEWPAPERSGRDGYEWQPPEVGLLASLVGRMSIREIATTLTSRLQALTGDAEAKRSETAVQVRINKIGMQTTDVVGGLTTKEAAWEVNSLALVQHAIKSGSVKAQRVGRLWVIPYGEWESWKAQRVLPPKGFVQLSSIRERLGIASDKLSEWARMGYIPTATRCTPFGGAGNSTKFGTWYISEEQAKKLLADRKSGRPMPWHGKPLADNMKATYKRWVARKHPDGCESCQAIWGSDGPPDSYEEYAKRYAALEHGAKRHLTMKWSPGLMLAEVAKLCGVGMERVQAAVTNGALSVVSHEGVQYVTKTAATRWKARKCPTGESERSWLSVETASNRYLFTAQELKGFIADGTLASKVGEAGAARGIVYVLKNQCAELRAKTGFSEEVAAKRAGVTVERLQVLLKGLTWRKADGIPLETVQAVIKRLESREGYTLEECAEALGTNVQWVQSKVADGTVRVSRAKWDRRRLYLSDAMLERLREALTAPARVNLDHTEWLRLNAAAKEAGVSATTMCRWAEEGRVGRAFEASGWRYKKSDVRRQARVYWENTRFLRAKKPEWMVEQAEAETA